MFSPPLRPCFRRATERRSDYFLLDPENLSTDFSAPNSRDDRTNVSMRVRLELAVNTLVLEVIN